MATSFMCLVGSCKDVPDSLWMNSDASLIEDKPCDLIEVGGRSIEDVGKDLLRLRISSSLRP